MISRIQSEGKGDLLTRLRETSHAPAPTAIKAMDQKDH